MQKIVEKWFATKEGVLDLRDLQETARDKYGAWYQCPCGNGHTALRCWFTEGVDLSPVLTCFVTKTQWLVKADVAGTILDEEERYFKLLGKADRIVPRAIKRRGMSYETLNYLLDTHGIHPEVTRLIAEGRDVH